MIHFTSNRGRPPAYNDGENYLIRQLVNDLPVGWPVTRVMSECVKELSIPLHPVALRSIVQNQRFLLRTSNRANAHGA